MSLFSDKQKKELEKFFREFPQKVAVKYLNHIDSSFENEGFTDDRLVKWKPRKRADKNKKQKRRLLVKTGRLRRSIKKKVTGTKILIYTATPYAKIHNEGGQIKATAKVRKHKRRIKKGRKRKTVDVKAHTRRMNTKIPKRQFMGESKKITKQLEQEIEAALKRIFK